MFGFSVGQPFVKRIYDDEDDDDDDDEDAITLS